MQCGKYLINHLQREIFLSGKLVVIFFLCIFARPNGLRMNPLLHDELRHGRILFRLWSTGFHCQKSECPRDKKSFDTLVRYHTDKLMISKLRFFKYITSILRPFLLRFQTSIPMIPFLAVQIDVTLRQLTSSGAKRKVVSDANTHAFATRFRKKWKSLRHR